MPLGLVRKTQLPNTNELKAIYKSEYARLNKSDGGSNMLFWSSQEPRSMDEWLSRCSGMLECYTPYNRGVWIIPFSGGYGGEVYPWDKNGSAYVRCVPSAAKI